MVDKSVNRKFGLLIGVFVPISRIKWEMKKAMKSTGKG